MRILSFNAFVLFIFLQSQVIYAQNEHEGIHDVVNRITEPADSSADKDYRITVLSDCCADANPEVHRVLTAKVFLYQTEVLTIRRMKQNVK